MNNKRHSIVELFKLILSVNFTSQPSGYHTTTVCTLNNSHKISLNRFVYWDKHLTLRYYFSFCIHHKPLIVIIIEAHVKLKTRLMNQNLLLNFKILSFLSRLQVLARFCVIITQYSHSFWLQDDPFLLFSSKMFDKFFF